MPAWKIGDRIYPRRRAAEVVRRAEEIGLTLPPKRKEPVEPKRVFIGPELVEIGPGHFADRRSYELITAHATTKSQEE